MPFARDISAWTYLYGRNILYYFKKRSTFSYFRRISRFVCEKSEASLHPKKRKDIFIPPNVFPRKICLPSKYRATSYNRILNVTLSLSFSLHPCCVKLRDSRGQILATIINDPPLINEANIKFYLLETLENITSNQQKVRSFSQRCLCHANRSTRLDETRAWCARFAAAEGTGGRKASWKGGEESSSLHSGVVVAAAERCSVGFHRGGCLAATTKLYLSAV